MDDGRKMSHKRVRDVGKRMHMYDQRGPYASLVDMRWWRRQHVRRMARDGTGVVYFCVGARTMRGAGPINKG